MKNAVQTFFVRIAFPLIQDLALFTSINKYKCRRSLYVGVIKRHLHTRMSEHMGISPYTGKLVSSLSLHPGEEDIM